MFNFRDKVIVNTSIGKIEGYVYYVPVNNSKEIYVVLTGQNTKPVIVETRFCEKILEPGQVKRGRGRPRKDGK